MPNLLVVVTVVVVGVVVATRKDQLSMSVFINKTSDFLLSIMIQYTCVSNINLRTKPPSAVVCSVSFCQNQI